MNWQPAAFDPQRRLIFVPAVEGASVFTKSDPDKIVRGKTGHCGSGVAASTAEPPTFLVRALDAATGARRWEYRAHTERFSTIVAYSQPPEEWSLDYPQAFFSRSMRQRTGALAAAVGGNTLAAPISFKLDGRQVIAVLAGQSLIVFGL